MTLQTIARAGRDPVSVPVLLTLQTPGSAGCATACCRTDCLPVALVDAGRLVHWLVEIHHSSSISIF
jgi:hypothetical protein